MATMNRVRMVWNGASVVGDGVSTFYFPGSATGFQAAVVDFSVALQSLVPNTVGLRVEDTGDVIEDTTGDLVGTWTEGSVSDVGGANGSAFAAGVGLRIVWATNGITNNRRVKGTTFICPIGGDQFAGDGTLTSGARADASAAASVLQTTASAAPVIWRRPRPGVAGGSSSVISGFVPDEVSWLRSRRT
jgi:hypothetical protein